MLPTQGKCEGGYVWNITEGRFGEVPLAGLSMSWLAHFRSIAQGNVTGLRSSMRKPTRQRAALTTFVGREVGRAVVIFFRCYTHRLGPKFAPFHVETKNAGQPCANGDMYEVELGPILNPVTSDRKLKSGRSLRPRNRSRTSNSP